MALSAHDGSKLSAPPAEMLEFVKEISRDDFSGKQKRKSNRHPLVLEALVVPLDEKFEPAGDPFMTLTRNVSSGGVCLVHTQSIRAPFLQVTLDVGDRRAVMVARVRRCRQLKRYFEVGCEFVSRTR